MAQPYYCKSHVLSIKQNRDGSPLSLQEPALEYSKFDGSPLLLQELAFLILKTRDALPLILREQASES